MALNPGDTLNNNHYRILRQLGRGGFGFVHLAQDGLVRGRQALAAPGGPTTPAVKIVDMFGEQVLVVAEV
jgi:serine/threonine protein kinase